MKAISQNEAFSLIADINAFADDAERLISNTQASYEQNKNALLNRQRSALSNLDNAHNASCAGIRNSCNKTIFEAQGIMDDISALDEKLIRVDKYYVKTKKKKEEELSGKTSDKYESAEDYFSILDDIKSEFHTISKKYSEDILPGLINGINYLFSKQRKKDYEELIVLKNTVALFIDEIKEVLPPMADENISEITQEYKTKRSELVALHNRQLAEYEEQYIATTDAVAGAIFEKLDALLPDEFVEYLRDIISNYTQTIYKVNVSDRIQDEAINMSFVEYPVDYFVQAPIVAAIIKDKCSNLMVNGAIRIPIINSIHDFPAILLSEDGENQQASQAFAHSVMFGILSSNPVSKTVFSIIDPENRGNSVSVFFDARKKLPELFGEKFYIAKEDISSKINNLNEKIENILQNKLGNQYDTIFDYAIDNPEYEICTEMLVAFNFPMGFDEKTLSDLKNIIRNGSRCGIYTLLLCGGISSDISQNSNQSLTMIRNMCVSIEQNGDTFLYRGMPLLYFAMPDKVEFAKFFSKYMLIFEGLKNRGIAFSPLIRKLIDAKDSIDLDTHIQQICDMMNNYEKAYAQVPDVKSTFPSLVTLGNVLYPADVFSDSIGYKQIVERFGVDSYVELPLTFDLKNTFNLFLNCPESSNKEMLNFTHHVIWSFLSFMPVTKVNVCVFDSEQRGNSIIPFLDFRKKVPEVFDQKIYTNQEAMYDRLQKINAQIDEFIQEKLGNRYRDILDYNLNTPNRAEAVTLLVLYDFPSGMDGRSIDLLTNILRNGNKCGVFTMICYNPSITFSRYENIDERLEQIMKYCVSVDNKDGKYSLLPYNLQVNIPAPLPYDATDNFINDYVEKGELIKKQGLSFKDIISKDLFSFSSAKSLKIPVGVGDGDSIINITIGEGSSHHGLIAGATGSGKSTLLHTLIMSSMLHYSPDQLHLYLMDFKSGTEFKVYETVKLPHIQLLALDAMQEFGESILENLVSEMEKRGSLFKSVGQTSLKGYTQATGQAMPRILVIMDEFQILFNDSSNRKVAMNCAELTKRIVTEGRAFGIHLLMATQSTKVISDLTLSHGTIEQMRIRIGLKCGESDARYMFSDENDSKALAMMKGPIGTAVMNLDYTEQSNIGFRAAYCDDETQKHYLELISQTYANTHCNLQTFEGGRTTRLSEYLAEHHIGTTDELPVKIHMGSLIKVAPPFVLTIDKKKKHNMLVCGSNERMANLISNNYMISALLNKNASVYCIDGDKLVGDDSFADFYDTLCNSGDRFKIANDRADIIKFINEIYRKYQAWKKQNSDDVIFVVIKNLQFLDVVKAMFKGDIIDESEFVDETEPAFEVDSSNPFAAVTNMFANRGNDDDLNVTEKLTKMIEDGSGFGIHFVVTSLEYQSVRESMYYGQNVLNKFPERIIFSLGSNDADNLIENVSVAGLRENTVYFTDGVKNTFQLKPYITPSIEELEQMMN
ncbi:MAG: cell division protein FtsK [Clostridia bacterium]|nr:cell division protein FtsK [Clostridia bacterium]